MHSTLTEFMSLRGKGIIFEKKCVAQVCEVMFFARTICEVSQYAAERTLACQSQTSSDDESL